MNGSLQKPNPLETEPVGKLLCRYSIPTAMTLMVNNLYNIADQIFIGQGVGVTGMAATNVAFPLTIITISLALMIGDGCAANMSLCLGRKQQEEADRTVSQAVFLLIAAGIFLVAAGTIFSEQIVMLFGATETAFKESLVYTRIIVWGLPFLMFSSSLTAIIRADGDPKYTMKCMILGTVINLILDPLFIFVFHMGVAGAAIATVTGQAAAGSLCLIYLPRLRYVSIHRKWMRPESEMTIEILKLGFPSFLTQIMTAVVQITMNNLMNIYGSRSVYGGDMALSAYGMMMKVYQIAHAMFVGVSSAAQPINGYNFGAGHYGRVKKTYRTAASAALIISIVWFAVYQLAGRYIGMMFVSGDDLYLDAAQHIFHIYMLMFFVYGVHMATSSFFQGIGRPVKAMLIPFIRQGIVLIPAALILSHFFGFDGALAAAPIADIISFLVSIVFVTLEFRNWRKEGLTDQI